MEASDWTPRRKGRVLVQSLGPRQGQSYYMPHTPHSPALLLFKYLNGINLVFWH